MAAAVLHNRPRKVALAAGGTGGHLFPAQALARALLARGLEVVLITDRRGGGFGPDMPAVETHAIAAGGIAGIGLIRRLKNYALLALGSFQARSILKACKADCLVGFGGYPSVPPVLAAAQLKLPIILHEQNAVLGRANQRLARYARHICTAFAKVQRITAADQGKVILTGNPVRAAISAIGQQPYAVPGTTDKLHLLVVGGSQGAAVFNDLVPEAIALLPGGIRERLSLVQQVPGEAMNRLQDHYQQSGVEADLANFFEDMPQRLTRAHLVIGRAGASTVAELAAAGRPAILVPFPAATDDHQSANAQALCDAGGAWMMPQASLTPKALAERLQELFEAPATLTRAARFAAQAAHAEAAERLAAVVCGDSESNGKHAKEAAA